MKQIKTFRERANLTQRELAKALNVSEITVRKWESGERQPRSNRIKGLARKLRCGVEQLL